MANAVTATTGTAPAVAAAADLAQRLGPVDAGQLQVHEDQVRSLLRRQPDAVLPGRRLDHLVAGELQDVPDQLHVLRVVLDDEDALAAHGASRPGSGPPAGEHADRPQCAEQRIAAHRLDEVRRGSECRAARTLVDDRDDDDRDVPGRRRRP